MYKFSDFALSEDSISTLNSDPSSDHPVDHHDRSAADSFISVASDDSHAGHHATDFHHDAVASIFDSLQKGDDPGNIQLELTALRMSSNASEHQVRRAVVAAFMKRISQLNETCSTGVKASVHAVVSGYAMLINKTIYDKEKSGKVDQVDFLLLAQTDLCHRKDGEKILPFLAMELYDRDVIEENGFVQWWSDVKASEGEEMQRVRSGMQGFVDALAEAEEDETSDEEESESEEE